MNLLDLRSKKAKCCCSRTS